MFEGCGGNCGSVTSTSVNPVDSGEALSLGYAVVNTDTGHEQDPMTVLLTWAVSDTGVVNMPAIIDFFYRAVHQMTVATKQYVEATTASRSTMPTSTAARPVAGRAWWKVRIILSTTMV